MKKTIAAITACLTAALTLTACRTASPADGEFQKQWREDTAELWEDIRSDVQEEIRAALDDAESGEQGKKHYYEVLDSDGETVCTIDGAEGVRAVDDLLGEPLDGRGDFQSEIADGALYTYVFRQERTLRAGEDDAEEREYVSLLRIAVPAEGNVLTVQVNLPEELAGLELPAGLDLEELLTFGVEVSEETAESLREPEKFA